jgi:hypothetical protein
MESHSVYMYKYFGYLYEARKIINMYVSIRPRHSEAVSRWLPTVAVRVRVRGLTSGICGGQSTVGAGFFRVLRFPLPKTVHSTNFSIITIIRGS